MTRAPSLEDRASGILLHPTSLPGGHFIGDLGPEAHHFVDILARAGQVWWQMFPLGHPGMGDSPYASLSAHAGNPLLISLDFLHEEGYLAHEEVRHEHESHARRTHVDFHRAWEFKSERFRAAYVRFAEGHGGRHDFDVFCAKNDFWLNDYALFCALKESMKGEPWTSWPDDLRRRKPAALRKAATSLRFEVDYFRFLQFQFSRQWNRLRQHCREKGIGLIGDIPIFVAHDSADVWTNPKSFFLDSHGMPTCVAGTPPDYFSATGQRWGNPLYRWDVMKKNGYKWWVDRFRSVFGCFDAVRLDHFIGFQHYWRIPAEDSTAQNGAWMPGPRSHFFKTIFRKLGPLQLIAEDLGLVTAEVNALRDEFDFPGMRILQFAFGSDNSNYLPHNHPRNCVVYTGTHDNDTTVGWYKESRKERDFVHRYTGSDGKEIHWDLIRLAFMSVAKLAVIPAQDILGLGSEARTNVPGTPDGNWRWRFEKGDFDAKLCDRLRELTDTYSRLSKRHD